MKKKTNNKRRYKVETTERMGKQDKKEKKDHRGLTRIRIKPRIPEHDQGQLEPIRPRTARIPPPLRRISDQGQILRTAKPETGYIYEDYRHERSGEG